MKFKRILKPVFLLFVLQTIAFSGWTQARLFPEELEEIQGGAKVYYSVAEALPESENVLRLDIRQQHYTSFTPDLSQLLNLEFLNATKNQMAEVAPEIGGSQYLKEIVFRENSLWFLPDSFFTLANLQTLDLSQNQFSEMEAGFGKLQKLEVLLLQENLLQEIAPEIGNMKRLSVLDLSHNQLETLPSQMAKLHNLHELTLTQNNLRE